MLAESSTVIIVFPIYSSSPFETRLTSRLVASRSEDQNKKPKTGNLHPSRGRKIKEKRPLALDRPGEHGPGQLSFFVPRSPIVPDTGPPTARKPLSFELSISGCSELWHIRRIFYAVYNPSIRHHVPFQRTGEQGLDHRRYRTSPQYRAPTLPWRVTAESPDTDLHADQRCLTPGTLPLILRSLSAEKVLRLSATFPPSSFCRAPLLLPCGYYGFPEKRPGAARPPGTINTRQRGSLSMAERECPLGPEPGADRGVRRGCGKGAPQFEGNYRNLGWVARAVFLRSIRDGEGHLILVMVLPGFGLWCSPSF